MSGDLERARRAARLDLVLVVAICLAKGIVWTVVQPPLQTPDELAHFTYVQYLGEQRALPRVGSTEDDAPELTEFCQRVGFDDIRSRPDVKYRPLAPPLEPLSRFSPNGNSSAAGYPPGYYALAALGYRAVYHAGIAERFYAARIVSVLLGLVTACAAWFFGRSLFPGERTAAVAIALLAGMQPMNSMLSAAVNNDALLLAASAAAIAIAFGSTPGSRPLALVGLGLAIGVGLLAKPQMAFVALGACAVLVLRRGNTWRASARAASIVCGSALACFGWWAVYSFARFGSPFGTMVFQTVRDVDGSRWHYIQQNLLSIAGVQRAEDLWIRTYWGRFGWLDTSFPGAVYRALLVLVLAAALGIVIAFRRGEVPGRRAIALCTVFVLANVAFLYFFEAQYVHRFHATMLQGRYLLTALLPISVLLLAGCRALAPLGREAWVDAVAAAGALLLNVASIRLLLFRYYGIGIRDAVAHPAELAGIVPHPLFVAAEIAAVLFAVLGAVLMVRVIASVRSVRDGPAGRTSERY